MNRHLEFPSLCPSTILDKLNECWKYDPQDRPSFHILVDCFHETKTELGKLIPDIQDSRLEEIQQYTDDQVDKIPDSIEQQDKSTLCHKHKKHKSCAIFSLIFLVMCSAGAVYAFRNFIWIRHPPGPTDPTGKEDYLITPFFK